MSVLQDTSGSAFLTPVTGAGNGTDTSAITVIAAQGTGLKLYITSLQIGRTDNGTSAITVTLNDDATSVFVVPNAGSGGVIDVVFPIPLTVAANTAFTATSSGGVTTLYVNGQGYSGS